MIYGDELHEAELKEDGKYLAVFEQSVPGEETVSSVHVAEAVQYRELDQKYWRG